MLAFIGSFGYLSALLAGFLFASTFTVAIGGLLLLNLGHSYPPLLIALVAGLGALSSDFVIFSTLRHKIIGHINPVYRKVSGNHLKKILHTRYFAWSLPVIGAVIMALPLPDELGVSLLSISQIKPWQFLVISYCSHLVGISLVLSASLI